MFSNLINFSVKGSNADTVSPGTDVSLQVLLNDLVTRLPETIAINKVIIANQVASNLTMRADQDNLVTVIDELLTIIAINARNTSLFITAEKFIDTVTLYVEDRNNYNGYALSFSLMALEQQARHIGGNLAIKGAQQRITTVSLSFPDTIGYQQPTCE